jgi:arylsulfatase A-like enzyme
MSRLIFAVASFVLFAFAAASAERPNLVLILADDVGVEAIGCYGGVSYRTPNLDRLAAEGVRFTHAYAQPLCTPTRVQIMTGKYNHRNWRCFGILDPDERTFGHWMKSAGYATGIFGKWQLYSYDPPEFPNASRRRGIGMHPQDAGFDRYALFHALHTEAKGSRYANPTMLEGTAGSQGVLKTYAGRYGEDIWVEKILEFLSTDRDRPAFVYYPMALPHWPFVPTPDSADWDPSQPQVENLKYAADMIEYMDVTVGNLVDGLQRKRLLENTIILFYSDNGTHLQVASKMKDGRTIQGGKAAPTQTGIHVPLIAHWPGHFPPSVCNAIVDASDFLPTLLDLGGKRFPDDSHTDGISFASCLFGTDGPRRETAFFWYDPRPGWDKERFGRHVFAVNRTHKLFRDGRFFRLTDRPLEEIAVDRSGMTERDRAAERQLSATITRMMAGVDEPPLVDAYGEPIATGEAAGSR